MCPLDCPDAHLAIDEGVDACEDEARLLCKLCPQVRAAHLGFASVNCQFVQL